MPLKCQKPYWEKSGQLSSLPGRFCGTMCTRGSIIAIGSRCMSVLWARGGGGGGSNWYLNLDVFTIWLPKGSQVTASLFQTIITDIKKSSAKKSFHDFSFAPLSSFCDPGLHFYTNTEGSQRQCDSWNGNKQIKGSLFSPEDICYWIHSRVLNK